METNKRHAIRRYSDHATVAWFTAESFTVLTGTTMVSFKDRYGSVTSIINLEPGHYICLFDPARDKE